MKNKRKITFINKSIPNMKIFKILAGISKDVREDKNMAGPFDSINEMIEALDSKSNTQRIK